MMMDLRTVKIVILTIRIGQIDILIIAVHNTLDFNHWISYTYVNNGIDLSHLFQVSHTLQRPTREIIEEFFYDDGLPFMVEKINLKYLGTLDHPLAKMLIDKTRNGIETVLADHSQVLLYMGFWQNLMTEVCERADKGGCSWHH